MSAAASVPADSIEVIDIPAIADGVASARALALVRDGVITGEGPTTRGRVHFSRSLDADDAAWCERVLLAAALADLPVSRAEAETLFEISDAAAERSDEGRFDGLLARAVVHHAAAASGLPVPPRNVALSPETPIESWAPTQAVGVNVEVLEWIAGQMRGKRRASPIFATLAATLIGAATLPLVQSLPSLIDLGM
ncbi:MAG: hypothetical protein WBA66_00630 [Xanthobacteraceae bacterium]